jgi:uncharacterized protein (TIGR00255 family)
MSVRSMTGFARADGSLGTTHWSWEVKTVNGKGLDIRLRLPPGFDALEVPARAAVAAVFSRGSCQIGLSVKRQTAGANVRINREALDAVLAAMAEAAKRVDAAPPRLDGLFQIKGILETEEVEDTPEETLLFHHDLLAGLDAALAACAEMRLTEGGTIARTLLTRIEEIEALTREAEANPARQPGAIKDRLAILVRALLDSAPALDPDRLHQEAILIATRADIREELDRLHAHVAQARDLLGQGGTIGRKLDFLAQEFNREVNTLCSKANDVSLTKTGLALKTVVEQFREQVQNIE